MLKRLTLFLKTNFFECAFKTFFESLQKRLNKVLFVFRMCAITSILFFTTHNAQSAELGDWLIDDLLIESVIYDATKEACSNIQVRDMYEGLAFDNLYAGIFPSDKFNKLTNAISREAFLKNSIYIFDELTNEDEPTNENRAWLVNSKAFNRAVKECFTNAEDQKRFKYFVEKREKAGKILGTVVTFLGVGKVFSFIAKFSKVTSAVIDYGSIAGLVGYLGYDSLETFLKKKYVYDHCGEIPSLSCLQEVLYDLPEDHPDQKLIEEIENSDLPEEFVQSLLR